ncbi:9115_t:CDS:2 [Entrophospora sp. SA101]|nr:9115_t:CDS:2 [Entrophospora sp. SA101]
MLGDVVNAVVRAFGREYKDYGLLKGFEGYLEACGKEWREHQKLYYAPYCTMFQSSGIGKSRMLHRFAETGDFYVFYINVNNPRSGSYPCGHPKLHNYFTITHSTYSNSTYDVEKIFQIRLVYFVYVLLEHLCSIQDIQKVRQEVKRVIAMLWGEDALSEAKQFDIGLWTKQEEEYSKDYFSQYEKETYVDIEWKMHKLLNDKFEYIHEAFTMDTIRNVSVLFAFDEAQTMINIEGEHEVNPVFTEQQESWKKFPPFFAFPTFDIYAPTLDELIHKIQEVSADKVVKLFDFANIIVYGRPLWKALFDAGIPGREIERFAQDKLFTGNYHAYSYHKLSFEEVLSLVAFKISINLHTIDQHTATNMVAKNMGICVHVSDDQSRLGVMCLSEPILANAVTEILLKDSFLENTLDILDNAMKKGMFDGSVCGELVARFLLTLAKDVFLNSDMEAAKITTTSPYCCPVTVHDYFISMIGETNWNRIFGKESTKPMPPEIANGWISMTHFMSVESEFKTPNELLKFWYRCAAIIPRCIQPNVDLVIPILPTSFWKNGKMSYILIQVKNYQSDTRDKFWPASATSKLKDWLFFKNHNESSLLNYPPYITLFMDLGKPNANIFQPCYGKSTCSQSNTVPHRQYYAVIDGLDVKVYPFLHILGNKVIDSLQSLRKSHMPLLEQIDITLHPAKEYNIAYVKRLLISTGILLNE